MIFLFVIAESLSFTGKKIFLYIPAFSLVFKGLVSAFSYYFSGKIYDKMIEKFKRHRKSKITFGPPRHK